MCTTYYINIFQLMWQNKNFNKCDKFIRVATSFNYALQKHEESSAKYSMKIESDLSICENHVN